MAGLEAVFSATQQQRPLDNVYLDQEVFRNGSFATISTMMTKTPGPDASVPYSRNLEAPRWWV